MAAAAEPERTYRTLYGSALLAVRDYRCRQCRCGPGHEESPGSDCIVLLRHGAFTRHFGRRRVTADANRAVLFDRGSSYRVSHPADGGDRGTILELAPAALRELLREVDAATDDRAEPRLERDDAPCSAPLFWRHRQLLQRLEHGPPPAPLWVDQQALQLSAAVLAAAFACRPAPKRQRADTALDHGERIDLAKAFLAAHLGDRVALADVARAAHSSPFHLARLFQHGTGVPLHRYHLQLRLRAALERLTEGDDDLTAIALDLGFSSHSHFTDRFRQAFGCAPSSVRRGLPARRLRQMRKNLEV